MNYQQTLIQEMVISILPVFGFLLLGWLFRRSRVFTSEQMGGFKKLVVQFSLPSLLFLAFFSMPLTGLSLTLASLIFIFCLLALMVGKLIAPRVLPGTKTGAYVYSGFEAGMLGYGLFLGFFGQDQLGFFALIDLGQVLFVFLVLVPLLKRSSGFGTGLREHIRTIGSTPVVWAILLGLMASVTNLVLPIAHTFGFMAFTSILTGIGAVTVPLICFSVGFDLNVMPAQVKRGLLAVVSRIVIMVPAAFGLANLLLPRLLNLGISMDSEQLGLVQAGIWILFLLPPPFVIPAFLPPEAESEAGQISSVLSLHTLISVLLIPFVVLLLRS
jgi:predicted permease